MSLKWCHILSSWFFLVLVKYVYFASWNNFTENFLIVWHLLRRPEMQVGVLRWSPENPRFLIRYIRFLMWKSIHVQYPVETLWRQQLFVILHNSIKTWHEAPCLARTSSSSARWVSQLGFAYRLKIVSKRSHVCWLHVFVFICIFMALYLASVHIYIYICTHKCK